MAAASDEAEYTLETASIHGFNVGSWNANNNPDGSAWERNFEGIFAANLFLKESDEVDLDYLKYDPTKQQDYQNRLNNIHRWKYEARFLRAYYYFELVKRYGGVPIITEPLGLKSDLSTFSRDSLSACIRKAAISAAKDTISKNDRYVLSGREVRELFSVLDNGFVPNKRLQEAMTIAEQIEKNGALNAGF